MKKALFVCAVVCLAAGLIHASAYNTSSPIAIGPGECATVWSAETPTPGNGTTAASQQVFLSRNVASNGTPFSVDGQFSGDPGAFEIDVQASSTDSDTRYQTVSGGNMTTVDGINFTFRLGDGQEVTRYVRLLMRSRTNSVSVTATVCR